MEDFVWLWKETIFKQNSSLMVQREKEMKKGDLENNPTFAK